MNLSLSAVDGSPRVPSNSMAATMRLPSRVMVVSMRRLVGGVPLRFSSAAKKPIWRRFRSKRMESTSANGRMSD